MLCRLEIWVCSSKDQTFSLFPFFPFSKTPHRFADFHLLGTVPLSIESWKILVRIGAISAAYSFRNHGGMASGPEALFVFNSDNCFATPSMVIDSTNEIEKNFCTAASKKKNVAKLFHYS